MEFNILGFKLKEKRIRLFGRLYKISAKSQLIFFIFTLAICLIIGFVINHNTGNNYSESMPGQIAFPTDSDSDLDSDLDLDSDANSNLHADINHAIAEETAKTILIHVSGAVKLPGIISLKEGSRVYDAIEAAGGLSEGCEIKDINLAQFVKDGIKIYIPYLGETPYISQSDSYISNDDASPTRQIININSAGINQLVELDGIGEATAKKIIAYREKNGNFKKIEDLLKVSGIGDAKFNAIKNNICV